MEENFQNLKLQDNCDINILLLGETGVGKSTFINSIANYLHYHDLDKALNDPLFFLIPCMFNITDDNFQTHKVIIGKDTNEYQQSIPEEAATTSKKSSFSILDFMFKKKDRIDSAKANEVLKPKPDVAAAPTPKTDFIDDFLDLFKPKNSAKVDKKKVGDSATQDVKTYVFPIGNGKTRVRLIDTPGMNDPRGIEQDDLNCENILSYIGQLHQLHAICMLFKPNEARVTVTFEYCVHQILSRLDKSAAANIIFIFTNAKGTHYKPGETVACLKKVVEDIAKQPPNVKINVGDNVFCFDNEAFRYLAAVKKGVEFGPGTKEEYLKSWKNSSEESWKLIRYILGDVSRPPLKPHMVKTSISINESRRMITQLGQPLADISQLIFDNLTILDRRVRELRQQNVSLDSLKAKLYVPIINLKVIKLTQPATVCHQDCCAEIMMIDGVRTMNYKQRCHDPCYLKNVPSDIVGASQLKDCASMDRTTQTCIKCGCAQNVHLHIYYMTEKFDDKKIDSHVQSRIDTTEKALAEAERVIGEIKKRKSELEGEKDVIINCAAKFAHFVQKNAISPINDAYRRYIEYMINREEGLGSRSDKNTILHLKSLLEKYDLIKTAFDKVYDLSKHLDQNVADLNPKTIMQEIDKLFALKHYGKKIKEMQTTQKTSRKTEHAQTEYVHASPVTKPERQTQSDIEGDSKKKEFRKKDFKNRQFVNKNNPNKFQRNKNFNKQDEPGFKTSTVTARTGPNEEIKIEITKSTGSAGGQRSQDDNDANKRRSNVNQNQKRFGNDQASRGNNANRPRDNPPPDNNRPPRGHNPPANENRLPFQNRPPYDSRPNAYPPPLMDSRPLYDNRYPRDSRPPYDNRAPHDNPPPPMDSRPLYDSRYPHDSRPPYDNRPPHDYPPPMDYRASYDNRGPYDNRAPYENRPPPNDYRPPPNDYRPPYDNRPQHDYRPPYDHRPPTDYRPPYESRPPHDYRPPQENRPYDNSRPPYDNRPPYNDRPYDNRDPRSSYDARGPPQGSNNETRNYYGQNYSRPHDQGVDNSRDKSYPPPYESLSSNERRDKKNNPKPRGRSRPKYRSSGEKNSSCNDSD